MSRNDRRFARFYYDDFIREYPEVYDDGPVFASWHWCLVAAEKAWPSAPELPRSVKGRALKVLIDAGLLVLGPRHTFALLGHDAERTRRAASGRAGSDARWQSDGNANASPNAMPRRERDENKNSTPPPPVGKRMNGTNQRALGTNPRAIGTSPRQEREKQKRGPSPLHEILRSIQTGNDA